MKNLAIILILLFVFILSDDSCKTPLECYTKAVDALKQDREEMRQKIDLLTQKLNSIVDQKASELREEIKSSAKDLSKEIDNKISIVTQQKTRIVRRYITIKENIALDNVKDTYNYELQNLSKTTFAVIIRIFFVYSGPANTHGYLIGRFCQLGFSQDTDKIVHFNHQHYNIYYNTETVEYVVPWDSSKTNILSVFIDSSKNTNAQNFYSIILTGFYEYN
jgi:hypothetical protein